MPEVMDVVQDLSSRRFWEKSVVRGYDDCLVCNGIVQNPVIKPRCIKARSCHLWLVSPVRILLVGQDSSSVPEILHEHGQ